MPLFFRAHEHYPHIFAVEVLVVGIARIAAHPRHHLCRYSIHERVDVEHHVAERRRYLAHRHGHVCFYLLFILIIERL